MNFEAYTYDGAAKMVSGTTVVQPNVWYHVACTEANGGLQQLFVNGVEEGTATFEGTLWAGGTMTELGTGSGDGFLPAEMLLSDVLHLVQPRELQRHRKFGRGGLRI